jgi:hypothetical protein
MKAKLVLFVLLAALALAGMPGASSAGRSSALTVGCRPVDAPEVTSAKEAGEESGDSVFKLTCHRCRRRRYCCYPTYSSYPCCRYYPSYSCYPSYGYSTGYSYYPGVTYYGW